MNGTGGGAEKARSITRSSLRGLVRADVACKTSGDQSKVKRTMKPTSSRKRPSRPCAKPRGTESSAEITAYDL
jgi:hypothetical protein